ncbi:hypothetical protein BJ878DRAFT_49217 [Calycina marina]|uniref:Uncharacterized protein n=1 Tax=Calycina marina TaxID=1763456 RepID=A0A9P7Z3T5_9HELO|nr:hypothetical protein BJ878DRAFT_49217 [Calycina marina]
MISLALYVDDGVYASELDTQLGMRCHRCGCNCCPCEHPYYPIAGVRAVPGHACCLLRDLRRDCGYHVWAEDEVVFGYKTWLYVAIAIWCSDRLARVARMWVTEISSSLVHVDDPGLQWNALGNLVYVCFPTLQSLRLIIGALPKEEIRVGRRLAIGSLLHDEASAGWARTGIVVCGPAGTCDDVRAAVAMVARLEA